MANAGLFQDKAVFQRLSEGAVDDYGNVYTGWAALGTRAADMRERTGKETVNSGALTDQAIATMRCRADSFTRAVTAADRVVIRGYTWAIKNVMQVDARNTQIEFLLERGVAA